LRHLIKGVKLANECGYRSEPKLLTRSQEMQLILAAGHVSTSVSRE